MLSTEVLNRPVRTPTDARCEMDERLRSTLRYYASNAADYAEQTATIDTSDRISQFVALLSSKARILDAGCGAGRDLAQFRARGMTAVGLDLSPQLAELARQRSGCAVIVGDLTTPPVLGRFHGIWAMASLLHVERPRIGMALKSLHAMLEPGGVLFSSVKRGHGEFVDETGRWFTLYDEDMWRSHLAKAGFDIIKITEEPPVSGSLIDTGAPGWIASMARAK